MNGRVKIWSLPSIRKMYPSISCKSGDPGSGPRTGNTEALDKHYSGCQFAH